MSGLEGHICVVEELDEPWEGERFRARCETCPWGQIGAEAVVWSAATVHFTFTADLARANALVAAARERETVRS